MLCHTSEGTLFKNHIMPGSFPNRAAWASRVLQTIQLHRLEQGHSCCRSVRAQAINCGVSKSIPMGKFIPFIMSSPASSKKETRKCLIIPTESLDRIQTGYWDRTVGMDFMDDLRELRT